MRNLKWWPKIDGQKSKFWSKIEVLIKNRRFGQTFIGRKIIFGPKSFLSKIAGHAEITNWRAFEFSRAFEFFPEHSRTKEIVSYIDLGIPKLKRYQIVAINYTN